LRKKGVRWGRWPRADLGWGEVDHLWPSRADGRRRRRSGGLAQRHPDNAPPTNGTKTCRGGSGEAANAGGARRRQTVAHVRRAVAKAEEPRANWMQQTPTRHVAPIPWASPTCLRARGAASDAAVLFNRAQRCVAGSAAACRNELPRGLVGSVTEARCAAVRQSANWAAFARPPGSSARGHRARMADRCTCGL